MIIKNIMWVKLVTSHEQSVGKEGTVVGSIQA